MVYTKDMTQHTPTKQKGFIKTIILLIIALALLKFVFNFDVIEFFKTPKVADTVSYIWNDVILFLWNNYIEAPFFWAWDNAKLLTKIGWDNLIVLLDKIKEIVVAIKN